MGLAGEWRDIYALVHATKQEAQPALDLLSALTQEKKAKEISPHNFKFCLIKFIHNQDVVEKFAQLWEEMRAQGVRDNIIVSNTFLRAQAHLGDEEGIRRYMEKMK